MTDFLEMVGPDAIRNFLQNWPFAAVVVGFYWFLWRQLTTCYSNAQKTLEKLLEKELSD